MNNNNNKINLNHPEHVSTNENLCKFNDNVKDFTSQNSEQTYINNDGFNNVNDIVSADEIAKKQVINFYNGVSQININVTNDISEFGPTNAICESFESATQSDAIVEIPNYLSDNTEQASSYVQSHNSYVVQEKECRNSVFEDLFVATKNENESICSAVINSSRTETNVSCESTNENSIIDEHSQNSSDLSAEYDGSEENSASNGSMDLIDMYPNALKWQLREDNPQLPTTVTVLEAPGGSKVYLVGTAHFSIESQDDVAKTIRATQPDIVMVELCKSRMYILSQDENIILEEAKNINMEKIRATIQQCGVRQGILSLLLLSMCAHITKELGMAPGGEFRRAFNEARQIPQCFIQLGDRPIRITMERALASLSLWKKLRMAWYLLTCRDPISKEDVERYKNKDLLEKLLSDMAGDFPELSHIMIQERDLYLAYSLREAAKPRPSPVTSHIEDSPTVVVGVVGMGHVPGIVEHWETVSENDIPPILSIPKPSRSSKIIKVTLRYSIYGLVIYGIYRVTPSSLWQKPINLINRLCT